MASDVAAIVLTGGGARRLGGRDKCWLEVGGKPVLERVLDSLLPWAHGPGAMVVVGPEHATSVPVVWAREEPPGSGPVAGIRAGLGAIAGVPGIDRVVLLAGDLPFAGLGLRCLLDPTIPDGTDVVLGVDSAGRDQYLFACWRFAALGRAAAGLAPDAPVRSIYRSARAERRGLPDEALIDCDTPADLERARRLAMPR